jgi:hypothetical protein
MRSRIETAAMNQHGIAAQRGWGGPATIGDDQLLRRIQQMLKTQDVGERDENEKQAKKARKVRSRAGGRTPHLEGTKQPQKPLGPNRPGSPRNPAPAEGRVKPVRFGGSADKMLREILREFPPHRSVR